MFRLSPVCLFLRVLAMNRKYEMNGSRVRRVKGGIGAKREAEEEHREKQKQEEEETWH